jgi:transposase
MILLLLFLLDRLLLARCASRGQYNQAHIRWISRVPETSKEAKQVLQEESEDWQTFSDESGQYRTRLMDLPQGKERWIMVRTKAGEQAARAQMEKKLPKAKEQRHKKLWHLQGVCLSTGR